METISLSQFQHLAEKLYLDYVNNFISLDGFASYYGLTNSAATAIIAIGKLSRDEVFFDK